MYRDVQEMARELFGGMLWILTTAFGWSLHSINLVLGLTLINWLQVFSYGVGIVVGLATIYSFHLKWKDRKEAKKRNKYDSSKADDD